MEDFQMKLLNEVAQRVRAIGLGELSQNEVLSRFNSLKQQLDNGLNGTGEPRLAIVRTGIPLITPEAWQNASMRPVLVQELGGENQNLSVAQKQADGTIYLSDPIYRENYPRNQRQVSFDTFIRRMAEPIVAHTGLIGSPNVVDVGISLGLPHKNYKMGYGAEAVLDTQDGVLPKENQITDWQNLSPEQRKIIQAVNNKVKELSNGEVQLGIGIGMNDTPAVAQDGGAAKNARDEGYKVKPTGFVFGTGTNAAFEERADEGKGKRNGAIDDAGGSANEPGLVNSEIGHAAWTDDPVSERLRQRLVEQGLLSESRKDVAELEHETGSYIPRRIAAAVTILGEEIIPNAANVATQIEDMAVESPSLVSDLATGATTLTEDNSTNTMLKGLALASLDRAKQVYALILATISEKVQGTEESQEKSAVLTEGSTIHRATKGGTDTLKRGTEIEAAKLGQEVTIIRASGLKGVGGVTMSWHELVKKA
jgi:hypothetical protein